MVLAVRATLDDSAALYTDGLDRLQQLVVAVPDGSVISLDKGSFVSSIASALIMGETRVRGAKRGITDRLTDQGIRLRSCRGCDAWPSMGGWAHEDRTETNP